MPDEQQPDQAEGRATQSLWDQLLDLLGIFPQFPLRACRPRGGRAPCGGFRSPRAQGGPEEARPPARSRRPSPGQAVNRYRRLQWLRSRSSSPRKCAWRARSAGRTASSSWPWRTAWTCKGTMMPLERRNEPQMLRSFWKQYPSYRVQPLLYRRYNELLEARAFLLHTHCESQLSEP